MANAYYSSPMGHGIQNRMLKFIVGLFDSKNPLTTWGLLWRSFDKVLAGSNPKPQWREMMLLIIYFFVKSLAHVRRVVSRGGRVRSNPVQCDMNPGQLHFQKN